MKSQVMSGLAVAAFTMIAAVTHADESNFIAPDDALNQEPIETSITSDETSTQLVSDGDQEQRARPDGRRSRRGPDASGRRGPGGTPGPGFRGPISEEQRERMRAMMARRFNGDSEKANEFREKMKERFKDQAREGREAPPWVRGDRPDHRGPSGPGFRGPISEEQRERMRAMMARLFNGDKEKANEFREKMKERSKGQARKDRGAPPRARSDRPDRRGPSGPGPKGQISEEQRERMRAMMARRFNGDSEKASELREKKKERSKGQARKDRGSQQKKRSLKNKPPRKKQGGNDLRKEIREIQKSIEQLSEKLDQQSA